jgi:DNA-binding XRE family transcriptional regulator
LQIEIFLLTKRKRRVKTMIKTPIKTTEDYNKIVGERLRFFRELHNITQTEIAQKLGYTSTGTWSLIENGIRGLNKTKMA